MVDSVSTTLPQQPAANANDPAATQGGITAEQEQQLADGFAYMMAMETFSDVNRDQQQVWQQQSSDR